MGLQKLNQCPRVNVLELLILTAFTFDPHPNPADTQAHDLFNAVRTQDPRGAENIQHPTFIVRLHQFQQPERSFAVKQKIFIEHKKRLSVKFFF